jgi:hypothetical protein
VIFRALCGRFSEKSGDWATMAAAEYLTDPDYFRQLDRRLEECRAQTRTEDNAEGPRPSRIGKSLREPRGPSIFFALPAPAKKAGSVEAFLFSICHLSFFIFYRVNHTWLQ